MIDKKYLITAKNIRNQFLKLTKELEPHTDCLNKLKDYLNNATKELGEYSDNVVSKIKNKSDVSNVGDFINKKMKEIEMEEQKIIGTIKPINDKLEKLKKEEELLYKELSEKYPNLSQKDMIEEIHLYL
jgi:chromosome segregation ATPase